MQIAKALGTDVTGVCSTPNVDMVRSFGADLVVDYTKEDFTRSAARYDLILDIAGTRSINDLRRVLTQRGTLVIIGGPNGRWLGPIGHWLAALMVRTFVSQRLVPFLSKGSKEGLTFLKELIDAGKLTPVIDRTYP